MTFSNSVGKQRQLSAAAGNRALSQQALSHYSESHHAGSQHAESHHAVSRQPSGHQPVNRLRVALSLLSAVSVIARANAFQPNYAAHNVLSSNAAMRTPPCGQSALNVENTPVPSGSRIPRGGPLQMALSSFGNQVWEPGWQSSREVADGNSQVSSRAPQEKSQVVLRLAEDARRGCLPGLSGGAVLRAEYGSQADHWLAWLGPESESAANELSIEDMQRLSGLPLLLSARDATDGDGAETGLTETGFTEHHTAGKSFAEQDMSTQRVFAILDRQILALFQKGLLTQRGRLDARALLSSGATQAECIYLLERAGALGAPILLDTGFYENFLPKLKPSDEVIFALRQLAATFDLDEHSIIVARQPLADWPKGALNPIPPGTDAYQPSAAARLSALHDKPLSALHDKPESQSQNRETIIACLKSANKNLRQPQTDSDAQQDALRVLRDLVASWQNPALLSDARVMAALADLLKALPLQNSNLKLANGLPLLMHPPLRRQLMPALAAPSQALNGGRLLDPNDLYGSSDRSGADAHAHTSRNPQQAKLKAGAIQTLTAARQPADLLALARLAAQDSSVADKIRMHFQRHDLALPKPNQLAAILPSYIALAAACDYPTDRIYVTDHESGTWTLEHHPAVRKAAAQGLAQKCERFQNAVAGADQASAKGLPLPWQSSSSRSAPSRLSSRSPATSTLQAVLDLMSLAPETGLAVSPAALITQIQTAKAAGHVQAIALDVGDGMALRQALRSLKSPVAASAVVALTVVPDEATYNYLLGGHGQSDAERHQAVRDALALAALTPTAQAAILRSLPASLGAIGSSSALLGLQLDLHNATAPVAEQLDQHLKTDAPPRVTAHLIRSALAAALSSPETDAEKKRAALTQTLIVAQNALANSKPIVRQAVRQAVLDLDQSQLAEAFLQPALSKALLRDYPQRCLADHPAALAGLQARIQARAALTDIPLTAAFLLASLSELTEPEDLGAVTAMLQNAAPLVETPKLTLDHDHFQIGRIRLPILPEATTALARESVPGVEAKLVTTPTVLKNLEMVAASALSNKPIRLEGPTSTGKTSLVEYLSHLQNKGFIRIDLSRYAEVEDLIGSMVGAESRYTRENLRALAAPELAELADSFDLPNTQEPVAIIDGILQAQARPHWRDGLLVKALKAGCNVLLDEINLAPTDVIERLNELFDDDNCMTLHEHKGEKIKPHPEARLFAAVNPASDGGRFQHSKAALSRWRFNIRLNGMTREDYRQIMTSRYGEAMPAALLAQLIPAHMALDELVSVERLGREVGAVNYSLRDLFKVADRFVAKRGQGLSDQALLRRELEAIYRAGFSDPHDLAAIDDVLAATLPYDGPDFYEDLPITRTENAFTIGDVTITKTHSANSRVPTAEADRLVMLPQVKRSLYQLASALERHENVLLVGPRAAGKSALVKLYAHLRGLPYVRQSFSRGTDAGDIVGRYGIQGWADGPLTQVLRPEGDGGIFVADEFNLGRERERVNSVLDSRQLRLNERDGERIAAHEDFFFVATQNPQGEAYGGRESLTPAVMSRFTVIQVPDITLQEDLAAVAHRQLLVSSGMAPPIINDEQSVAPARDDRERELGVVAAALADLHVWAVNAFDRGTLGVETLRLELPDYSVRQILAAASIISDLVAQGNSLQEAFLFAAEITYAGPAVMQEDKEAIMDYARQLSA